MQMSELASGIAAPTEAQFSDQVKLELSKLRASEVVAWMPLFGLPHLEYLDWPARVALSERSVLATFSSPVISSKTLGELVARPSWRSDDESEVEDLALRVIVAANPATPLDIAEAIIDSSIPDSLNDLAMLRGIRTGAIYEPFVRRYEAAEVKEILESGNVWERRRLTESPDCPSEKLLILLAELDHDRFATLDVATDKLISWSKFDNEDVRAGVARHPNCPPKLKREILDTLIQDAVKNHSSNSGVLAASNPDCTEVDLNDLVASYSSWKVMVAAAVNPRCSSKLRKRLDKQLRIAFADASGLNPGIVNFPSAAFQAMFKTKWLRDQFENGDLAEYNMHTIATHPNWPWDDNEVIGHQVFLAYFAMWGVQECICEEDYLGDRFLVPLIEYAIADNLDGTPSWGPCHVLSKMARSPNATPEWLCELSKESNRHQRDESNLDNLTIAIAVNHPKFPKEALAEFADGEALCQAPRTSKYWEMEFAQLSEDGRQAIANNDPLWIRADQKSLRRFDEMPEVLKWICIASGKAPRKHIQSAAESVLWECRAAAAKSGKISKAMLNRLAEDPNSAVADCAQATLAMQKAAADRGKVAH